jgi:hypothetical protein
VSRLLKKPTYQESLLTYSSCRWVILQVAHIIERSPQADMNRTTLLIPALCGSLDEIAITQALNQARRRDLNMWKQENIPYTVRKKRQAFFGDIGSQKAGKI